MKGAIYDLTMDLPLKIPYGDGYEFRLEHAAELAGQLAVQSKLSMRKIKRILLRVELAMRCYADRPLDASLLVLLAFQTELNAPLVSDLLPRSYLTPAEGKASLESIDKVRMGSSESTRRAEHRLKEWIHEKGIELTQLPRDRYSFPDNANYKDWAMVFQFLAPHYVPNHMDALNAVASVLVPSDD